ncbi:MAG TPA: tRNA preQ1(34) S-adenosylmethionine ribosyltransferase-isomerase QueA [Geopsychrobacteraceae bacterium]|nr:tRNA preQ1(34) S-adenosylmethionine ribosyltransferase-isomerase QueA [Geopsychrobacteraceae bacterium]
MQLEDFDFKLPEELIAQYPPERRDGSRLMQLNRKTGVINTGDFPQVIGAFESGDLLVINDTKVIPARLLGHKVSGGKVEVFLVRRLADAEGEDWLCMTRSSRSLKPGIALQLGEGLTAEVLPGGEAPHRHIRFRCDGPFLDLVEKVGHLPLPPYITRPDDVTDRERYQTVFASNEGAVAAPTAGLHFTKEILQQLRDKGVEIRPLTLHVGLGTFLPVRVDDVRTHRMHAEFYAIPDSTARAVNQAKAEGRRIVALGTTAARALESAVDQNGQLVAGEAESEIFIYPGYSFKLVDALITNFHLPKSTLLMLVSALAGRNLILQAYQRAVEERFRFFSYGDCMMIA